MLLNCRRDFLGSPKFGKKITIPKYAKHKRYGAKAGTENPNFLNPVAFTKHVLAPYIEAKVLDHTGPFVFQFQMMGKDLAQPPDKFIETLDRFLAELPKDFRYATEVRNKSILTPAYFEVLNRHHATHCFNHWTNMPALHEQMKSAADAGGLQADFYVSRILTPLGVRYEDAVSRFSPYDKLQQAIPQMRADLVRLGKRAISRNTTAFVIVNNRCEGNAPKTINDVAVQLIETLDTAEK